MQLLKHVCNGVVLSALLANAVLGVGPGNEPSGAVRRRDLNDNRVRRAPLGSHPGGAGLDLGAPPAQPQGHSYLENSMHPASDRPLRQPNYGNLMGFVEQDELGGLGGFPTKPKSGLPPFNVQRRSSEYGGLRCFDGPEVEKAINYNDFSGLEKIIRKSKPSALPNFQVQQPSTMYGEDLGLGKSVLCFGEDKLKEAINYEDNNGLEKYMKKMKLTPDMVLPNHDDEWGREEGTMNWVAKLPSGQNSGMGGAKKKTGH